MLTDTVVARTNFQFRARLTCGQTIWWRPGFERNASVLETAEVSLTARFDALLARFIEMGHDLGMAAELETGSMPSHSEGWPLSPGYDGETLLAWACAQPTSPSERRRQLLQLIWNRLSADTSLDHTDLRRALAAMGSVPRERFVPIEFAPLAYLPMAGDIGHGQSISNPIVVAAMTAAAGITAGSSVLDVGTGSGYQAAVLAELASSVVSIEVISELANSARTRLSDLGYDRVRVETGDGSLGSPCMAPFDAIVVAAGAAAAPPPLVAQLKIGGRLVMPIGSVGAEELIVTTRSAGDVTMESLGPVQFVPMRGSFGRP